MSRLLFVTNTTLRDRKKTVRTLTTANQKPQTNKLREVKNTYSICRCFVFYLEHQHTAKSGPRAVYTARTAAHRCWL